MKFERKLLKVSEVALQSVILDPGVKIKRISIKELKSQHCLQTKRHHCLLIEVFTNDASMVRGAPEAYKGSYKERVEGIIDHFVRQIDPTAHAHLEIIGPESTSVERLIPIAKLVSHGKISSASPVAETGRTYKIDYALIRGRHLIGPCPAIPSVLERLLLKEKLRTVLDMFAGTGIATKAVCLARTPESITVVERDESKVERMRGHMNGFPVEFKVADAFEFEIGRGYDLVVADPYFEDAINFLDKKLEQIVRWARIFVLASGRIEDVIWNKKIQDKLIGAGLHVTRHSEFGEVIFVARRRVS